MKYFIILSVLMAALLTACGGRNEEPAETPTTVAPEPLPTSITPATVPVQSAALTTHTWAWIRVVDQAVGSINITDPQNYTVTFMADGSVQVTADCNQAAGSYATSGDSLTIAIGPATQAACPSESRGEQFLTLLGVAAKYEADSNELRIDLQADGGSLFFIPVQMIAVQPTALQPTLVPPTLPPPPAVQPTLMPPTLPAPTPLQPTLAPEAPPLPNEVVDGGPRTYATGTYQVPYYTVAAGDTLFSIAQRFGVSAAQIAAANALVNNAIYAGEQLRIAGGDGDGTQLPGSEFERVSFPAGDISATLNSVIVGGEPKAYVLGATAGQTLEIGTTSSGEALSVILQGPDGSILTLNGLNDTVQNNVWLTLPATGDYFVTITSMVIPENPTLNFTITFLVQ